MNSIRSRGVLAIAGAVLAVSAFGVGSAHADGALPVFDYSDCPALPSGVDPSTWRCEVHLASGEATFGSVTMKIPALRLTHAEGKLPDGTTGQVWGGLRSGSTVIPGTRVRMWLRYGGYADLVGNGPDPGGVYFTFALRGPLLAPGCTIGTGAAPVRTHMARVGATEILSTDPPVIHFTLRDTNVAVPAAEHCGPLTGLLNQRLGLPSPAGTNTITLDATYSYKMYDQLG
jgi:hypothetical protein